jgi:hypothetical protein
VSSFNSATFCSAPLMKRRGACSRARLRGANGSRRRPLVAASARACAHPFS